MLNVRHVNCRGQQVKGEVEKTKNNYLKECIGPAKLYTFCMQIQKYTVYCILASEFAGVQN